MRTARRALPYDYQKIEATVDEFVPQWRMAGFDAIVAIARGGLVPATMASTALSLPLFALSYARVHHRVSWFTVAQPAAGSKVLLVEDIAGRGATLSDSIDFLRAAGYGVAIFTLAYDAESRIKPDYGVKIPDGMGAWFPWERESITAAFGATSNQPDQAQHAYASWAIDLDGILLPDLAEHLYAEALIDTLARRDALTPHEMLPNLDLSNVTIITGRPEQDRQRTQAWLNRYGFNGPLVMRDETRYSPDQTAQQKADAILERCHTHFIESNPRQALQIAARAKVTRVLWWDGAKALIVHAGDIENLDMA
ncbi:MAG: phosphoribosyltransferase family protein [Burkholderiaceae bacterium]